MAGERFPSTSWTLIARAGELTPDGRAALAALCKAYWFPVYAFIRRRGGSPDDAYDRAQAFFVGLLERNDIAKVDRAHGSRFRTWLLRCVKSYLANEHAHAHAQKRVPPELTDSLSAGAAEGRYDLEPSHRLTPEHLYERQFALSVLARVIAELRVKYAAAGKEALFDALKGNLSGDTAQPHEKIAAALGMSTGAVKKAAFDLRARYKSILRAEVAGLLGPDEADDAAAVEEELRQLLAALVDEPA
jgi:DNA-directed RNA polymerase specialized sigma24 family protein